MANASVAVGHASVVSPAVLALLLAAAAVGTSELIIAGLLPTISLDLDVSIPIAGLLISAYALGVAVGGPVLSLATNGVPRRQLILVVMGVMALGQMLCAVAPNYPLLMAGRVIAASCQGLFFGCAIVIATRLVPENRKGTVIALISAGVTVATLAGVPAGTAIGNAFGWRWVFAAIAAMCLIAVAVLGRYVPRDVPQAREKSAGLIDELRPLARQPVYMSFVMIAVALIGYMAIFAYIAPFLTTVTMVPLEAVALLLLFNGVGAVFGNLIGGRLGDWKPMLAVGGSFLGVGFIYLSMHFGGTNPVVMATALFLLGLVGWIFVPPMQARIMKWSSDAPNLVAALISSAFNLGIAVGAWAGSAALAGGWAYEQLPLIGLTCTWTALALALISSALERRAQPLLGVSTG